MPQTAKKIYLFDLEGVELGKFVSASECAKRTGATRQAVLAAATRGSVMLERYYVSHDQKFVLPKRKVTRNPLRAVATRRDRLATACSSRLASNLLDEYDLDMQLTSSYLFGRS